MMSFTLDREVAAALAPMAESGLTPPAVGDIADPDALVRQGRHGARLRRPVLPRRRLHLRAHRPVRRARVAVRVGQRRPDAVGRVPPRARAPFPTPLEDAYAALRWLPDHAARLGVDPDHIGVMGDSAGGGMSAALTILARERGGPKIASQILLMPMLDDRTQTPDPHIAPYAIWSYDDSATAWSALLGDAAGGPDVPPTAAPARLEDTCTPASRTSSTPSPTTPTSPGAPSPTGSASSSPSEPASGTADHDDTVLTDLVLAAQWGLS
jgi:hypothetical protein